MSNNIKVGLVLSGGGALGAYQVGMMRALYESDIEVHAISGASIGALNGAIISSASTLKEGTERLEKLWNLLASDSPLAVNKSVYLRLLLGIGLRFNYASQLAPIVNLLKHTAMAYTHWLKFLPTDFLSEGLFSDQPLTTLMEQYLDLNLMQQGIPFYVSVFKSQGGIADLLSCVSAELNLSDTPHSEFIHIQSLPAAEQKEVLLASAALPLLFKPKNVGGNLYSDGGMGGWQTSQGNTPIQPLIDHGCNMVFVSHLCDGSLWSRHDFPQTTVIELRPYGSLSRNKGIAGSTKDLLGFTPQNINSWIDQGYRDTKLSISRVMKPLLSRQALRCSENILAESIQRNESVDSLLADAMKRIN